MLNFVRKLNLSKNRLSRKISSIPKLSSSELVDYPQTKITKLSNGLRVATETSPRNNRTATVGVQIDTGSRYESKQNNGCAHFLEHLAFKGTHKRSQHKLETEVENIGAHLNAYTSREQTVYYAQSMKNDIPQAVDILSDIISNSKITTESVDMERSVILREMEEVYKDNEEYVFDYLHDTAFLNTSLGQTILGPKENILKINRDDLLKYIATHYTTDRMVICGAGAIQHEDLVKLAEEKFAKIPKTPSFPFEVSPAKFTGSEYRERWDNMDMAHIAICYETCGQKNSDTFPLLFIHALLGAWDSSQFGGEHSSSGLVSAIASRKLGDKVMAFNTLYHDTGLFGVYLSAYERRVYEAMYHVIYALGNIGYDVTENMVNDVRNQITANVLMALDTSAQVCEDIGRQILTYGRRIHPAEMIQRINNVTAKDVSRVAHKYFRDKDHAMAAVGPIFELQDYQWHRRRSYNLIR